jgi:hypothetical protein
METTLFPTRAVLEGVERVHFYEGSGRCPEDITFPSVMRTVMEFLGENLGCKNCRPLEKSWGLGCAYSYFTGVSGMAAALNWAPNWGGDTYALMEHLPGGRPEMCRRALKAAGYAGEYLPPKAGEDALREKIKASIYAHKRPVISFGLAGPSEAGIITGYDEDGDVLIGWSFFQNDPTFNQGLEFEPNGYFRQRGWDPSTLAILLVGEKGTPPSHEETFLDALQWTVEVARAGQSDGIATGLAAYDAWIEAVLRDEDFPPGDEAAQRQHHEVHNNAAVGNVAELRWYASQWLVNTFEKAHFRLAEPLLKAAGCWAAEHELMWKVWDLAGGLGNPEAWRKFALHEVRSQIAPVLRETRAKEEEAIRWIEEAVKKA